MSEWRRFTDRPACAALLAQELPAEASPWSVWLNAQGRSRIVDGFVTVPERSAVTIGFHVLTRDWAELIKRSGSVVEGMIERSRRAHWQTIGAGAMVTASIVFVAISLATARSGSTSNDLGSVISQSVPAGSRQPLPASGHVVRQVVRVGAVLHQDVGKRCHALPGSTVKWGRAAVLMPVGLGAMFDQKAGNLLVTGGAGAVQRLDMD